jgi:hypothetical protein
VNRRAVGHSHRPGIDEKFSRTLLAALLVGAAIFLVAIGLGAPASASSTPSTAPPGETQPPITANDFIPEERDLTSCIGVLERPGCGSESRGGWRQTVILVAIFGGLAIIFGNVARGVRKNRRAQQR